MAGKTVAYTSSAKRPEDVELVPGINQEIKEMADIGQLKTTAQISVGIVTMLAYLSEYFMAI